MHYKSNLKQLQNLITKQTAVNTIKEIRHLKNSNDNYNFNIERALHQKVSLKWLQDFYYKKCLYQRASLILLLDLR